MVQHTCLRACCQHLVLYLGHDRAARATAWQAVGLQMGWQRTCGWTVWNRTRLSDLGGAAQRVLRPVSKRWTQGRACFGCLAVNPDCDARETGLRHGWAGQEERCLLVALEDATDDSLPPGSAPVPSKAKHRKRISVLPGSFIRLEELPTQPGS